MKKNIILAGALVGFIIALQLNSKLLPSRDTAINEQLDYTEVKQVLELEQNTLKQELDDLRQQEAEKQKFLDIGVQEKLEEAQKQAGFTKVSGEGLIIILTANESMGSEKTATFLRDTVNLLESVQAEAIAINGYRVVFKTPIIATGGNILIKNFHITGPFEIQVLGNTDFLLSALEVKAGFANVRQAVLDGDLNMEVKQAQALELPAYIY